MPTKKHILLTGQPSVGKTTVVKRVIKELPVPANGFYAEEECINGERFGFFMRTLDGKTGYLAHQNSTSEYRVHIYGVDIQNVELIAVPSITPNDNPIIVIDEIGQMQCLSKKFIEAAKNALDSNCIVIGTISLQNTADILEIKNRDDVDILEVTPENRDLLPKIILLRLSELLETGSRRMAVARDAL